MLLILHFYPLMDNINTIKCLTIYSKNSKEIKKEIKLKDYLIDVKNDGYLVFNEYKFSARNYVFEVNHMWVRYKKSKIDIDTKYIIDNENELLINIEINNGKEINIKISIDEIYVQGLTKMYLKDNWIYIDP